MKKSFANCWPAMVAFVVGATTLTALAQPTGRPDPAHPAAPVPGVKHQSVFSDYQAYQEPKLAPWKEVLEELATRSAAAEHAGKHGKNDQGASAGPGHEGHAKPKPAPPAGRGHASKDQQHMAMAKPHAAAPGATPRTARMDLVSGTGVVREIDKANRRVKITHEPIDALGWPGLTLFMRLKDGALADEIRENEKVRFNLEKSASGYVIAGFQKPLNRKDRSRGHHISQGEHK
jgi:Cu(I)/Ag(I) efflux system protein CusF